MYNSTLTAAHCCTIGWHVLFTGRLVLFLLSLYIYFCSCLYFLPFTLAHACTSFVSLLHTSSLCCAFLFGRHATSVVFLNLLCFDGIITFFFLVCFDWVCKAIWCHLESSIWSPARGSHSFEWIKPGWSTGIGSVCKLSVYMLKLCIHTSKLQDYSNSTQHVVISINFDGVLGVVSLWLRCICSMMMS